MNVAAACDPVSNVVGFSDDPSAVTAVIPIIEDILDAVSTAFLSGLLDPRTAAVVAPTTTEKELYWPVIRPKSSKRVMVNVRALGRVHQLIKSLKMRRLHLKSVTPKV